MTESDQQRALKHSWSLQVKQAEPLLLLGISWVQEMKCFWRQSNMKLMREVIREGHVWGKDLICLFKLVFWINNPLQDPVHVWLNKRMINISITRKQSGRFTWRLWKWKEHKDASKGTQRNLFYLSGAEKNGPLSAGLISHTEMLLLAQEEHLLSFVVLQIKTPHTCTNSVLKKDLSSFSELFPPSGGLLRLHE